MNLSAREWGLLVLLVSLALWTLTSSFLGLTSGPAFFMTLFVAWIAEVVLASGWLKKTTASPGVRRWLPRISLSVGTTLLGLALAEGIFAYGNTRGPLLGRYTLPDVWRERLIEGHRDYYYYGHRHRLNSDGFRDREFTAKSPGSFRIAVIGDSLVYGSGVAESLTLARRLERRLGERYRVDVMNLGQSGSDHAILRRIVTRYLPRWKPDLVLYGMCLNDVLPEHHQARSVRWPFPMGIQRAFAERTMVGSLIAQRMKGALIRMGLEPSFYSDIEDDWNTRAREFETDMRVIATRVRQMTGLPPMALVLASMPQDPETFRLTGLSEDLLRQAGFTVIPASPYLHYAQDHQLPMHLSPWEWHPDATANAIYAETFLSNLLSNRDLQVRLLRYRRTS